MGADSAGSSTQKTLQGSDGRGTQKAKPAAEQPVPRTDFFWDSTDEPHATRRAAILKAHPEVVKLQGPEWKSKWICLFLLVIPQMWLAWATQDMHWVPYLVIAYVFGATITQSLFLAIHELAHNLFFRKPLYNRLFSMIANLPIGIPYCVPFRGYHLEHHKYQGIDGIDTDIPSEIEARFIRGPIMKTIWCSCQILTYALRPMFIKPQQLTQLHVLNWAVQIAFDLAVYHFLGWKPIFWFVLCIFLAGGLHPCAGHFISEHYVFPHLAATQETYSYYGPLNYLCWNVGYHNEHHDFCYVPWSRLPELRRMAPEFYDNLAVCESWIGVIWDYIMRDDVGPYNRVKRPPSVMDAYMSYKADKSQ